MSQEVVCVYDAYAAHDDGTNSDGQVYGDSDPNSDDDDEGADRES